MPLVTNDDGTVSYVSPGGSPAQPLLHGDGSDSEPVPVPDLLLLDSDAEVASEIREPAPSLAWLEYTQPLLETSSLSDMLHPDELAAVRNVSSTTLAQLLLQDTVLPLEARFAVATALSDDCSPVSCEAWISFGFDKPMSSFLVEAEAIPSLVQLAAPRSAHECISTLLHCPFGPASQLVLKMAMDFSLSTAREPADFVVSKRRRTLPPEWRVEPDANEVVLSEAVEAAERLRQATSLLSVCPPDTLRTMLDFSPKEWAAIPVDRAVNLQLAHLTSFSAGSLRSCRAALLRLQTWLELNCLADVCTDFACSGGVLAMCAQDMQATSRGSAGGATVPLSLRNSWRFAQLNLGLVGLRADAPIMSTVCAAPSRTPSPALAATVAMLFHFVTLSSHANALVAHYAAGCVLCIVAALRLRDAQRASLRIDGSLLRGMCYTSKHPKRRSKVQMPFFAPLTGLGPWHGPLLSVDPRLDYIFPAVAFSRGEDLAHSSARLAPGPAETSRVVKCMRFLLTLPPLCMSKADALKYSGHSLRHFMPTLARLFGFSEEDRNELARWAVSVDRSRGAARAMPQVYSAEAAEHRVVPILSRLIDCLMLRLESLGGASQLPAHGGWSLFGSSDGPEVVGDIDVGAEPSSSESEDEL